jgi:hypothetical protein
MTNGWLVPGAMLLVFGLIALGHGFCLVRYLLRRKSFSVVPFIGGILGAIGLAMAPEPSLSRFWWIPLLVDYGSAPSLIVWIGALVRKWRST